MFAMLWMNPPLFACSAVYSAPGTVLLPPYIIQLTNKTFDDFNIFRIDSSYFRQSPGTKSKSKLVSLGLRSTISRYLCHQYIWKWVWAESCSGEGGFGEEGGGAETEGRARGTGGRGTNCTRRNDHAENAVTSMLDQGGGENWIELKFICYKNIWDWDRW